jgi:hypothetical protein
MKPHRRCLGIGVLGAGLYTSGAAQGGGKEAIAIGRPLLRQADGTASAFGVDTTSAPVDVSQATTGPGIFTFAVIAVAILLLAGIFVRLRKRKTGLRTACLCGAAVAVVATGTALMSARTHSAGSASVKLTVAERQLVAEINQARSVHGLRPVASNTNLVRAARFHSHDMVSHDYFAHGVFWKRVNRFGASGTRLGENLAWDSSQDGAAQTLVQAWLDSPEHRAVLLSRAFNQVGVGVAIGDFQGHPNALVVTADFQGL